MSKADYNPKILIPAGDLVALETSAFASTQWDIDQDTIPGQTVSAYKTTNWPTDDGDAEPNVLGFKAVSDNWS